MDLSTTYFTPAVGLITLAISVIYFIMASQKGITPKQRLGRILNGIFFIGAVIYLVIYEILQVMLTGVTISEHHWFMDQSNPEIGMLQNFLIMALFMVIFVHLGKFMIARGWGKKKDELE